MEFEVLLWPSFFLCASVVGENGRVLGRVGWGWVYGGFFTTEAQREDEVTEERRGLNRHLLRRGYGRSRRRKAGTMDFGVLIRERKVETTKGMK